MFRDILKKDMEKYGGSDADESEFTTDPAASLQQQVIDDALGVVLTS